MSDPANPQDSERAITRIWNMILSYAIRDGAREIHIEPLDHQIQVRFLIQGELHEQVKMPHYVMKPLMERIEAWAAAATIDPDAESRFAITLQVPDSGREREVRIRGTTLRLPQSRYAPDRPLTNFSITYYFAPTISYTAEGGRIVIKVETQLNGT
jgi:hypothetical protein